MKISVVVSAHNEEAKIEECLTSVLPLKAEIIVMDHDSDDKTAEIAARFTKHVYKTKNNPMEIDIQKNMGFAKATNDWILSLDADERLTPALIAEILSTTQRSTDEIVGYYIPRKNIIFGKWIEHTGWYPDFQLRLFKRGQGKFSKKHVHEMLEIKGETAYLSEPLLHLNYESVAQFLSKHFMLYAPNEADHLLSSGYTFSWQDAIKMPGSEFLSRYFARQGYLDGLHGLVLSLLMACYHLAIFSYLWEKKKFPNPSGITLLSASQEFRQIGRETEYWVKREKTGSEKNPLLRKIKKHFS